MRRPRELWQRRSLRARIALTASAATALAIVLVVIVAVGLQAATGGRFLDPDAVADRFDPATRRQLAKLGVRELDPRGLGGPDQVDVIVRDARTPEVIARGRAAELDDATLARPEWRRAAALLRPGDGVRARVEYAARPVASRVLSVALGGVATVLALVGLATWLAVGRALRSVEAIRAEVDEVRGDALHRRVRVPTARDEVAALAETMNDMLDRLELASGRQRRFIADASHELRSPVAGLKATTEVALAHPAASEPGVVLAEVHGETTRLERTVEDLLDLARLAESGDGDGEGDARWRGPAPEEVDLDEVVGEELRRLRRRHPGLDVDASRLSAGRVRGHRSELARLVDNLIANAARHGGGRVAVSLQCTGDRVFLEVEDDGDGIPVQDRERVFEPFVRLDASRARASGGTGLGLTLVRAIAERHGGTVSVADAPLGGARFEVELPAAGAEVGARAAPAAA